MEMNKSTRKEETKTNQERKRRQNQREKDKILPDLIDHSSKFYREKSMMWIIRIDKLTKTIDLHNGSTN